jgi:SAM-dependent methyltransferase
MDPQPAATCYDAYYFAHGCGRPYQRDDEWLRVFGGIADRLAEEIAPSSVLDAGCALGFLVESLRRRGVAAFGIDISEYAIANAHADIQPYCRVGSIAEPFPQRYDLIVCIEVLEHMPLQEAERAIANFCRHTDDVVFSSTPFDYKEPTHFNVQSPEYWAAQYARHGFYRDVDFDGSFITPWAARFRRATEPIHRVIGDYERRFWLLWKENTDLRALTLEMRQQLAEQSEALAQAHGRLDELHAQIVRKNEHIVYLEELIRKIESGRALRLLRRLGRIVGR